MFEVGGQCGKARVALFQVTRQRAVEALLKALHARLQTGHVGAPGVQAVGQMADMVRGQRAALRHDVFEMLAQRVDLLAAAREALARMDQAQRTAEIGRASCRERV